MTTLNHAFDANSLNGLACKIIKGRYPGIHPNFSSGLRELISGMLAVNPHTRPDLETILQKPFIKRHIQRFFSDIAARSEDKIGDGTMVLSRLGDAFNKVDDSDFESDTKSLKRQLETLGMGNLIAKAMNVNDEITAKPKHSELPSDERVAKRREREQSEALTREEERKRNVEAALQKLREEREERQKQRQLLLLGKQKMNKKQAHHHRNHLRGGHANNNNNNNNNNNYNNNNNKQMPVWGHNKNKKPQKPPTDLAKLRQQEIKKSEERRRERARQRQIEERNRAREEEEKRRSEINERRRKEEQRRLEEDARIKRKALELQQWEKAQKQAAEEQQRRRKLAIAAENARRKHEEEERQQLQLQKAARAKERKAAKKNAAFAALRKDKEELDAKLKRNKEEKLEIDMANVHVTPVKKGGISPQQNSSSPHSQTGSPIGELPVAYSSLESSSPNNSKSMFSSTASGKSNAIVKDPFARASRLRADSDVPKNRPPPPMQKSSSSNDNYDHRDRVAANKERKREEQEAKELASLEQARQEQEYNMRIAKNLQHAQYHSNNVVKALNEVPSKFHNIDSPNTSYEEEKSDRDQVDQDEEDEDSDASNSELDSEDDVLASSDEDIGINNDSDSDDEEEEDATLQKRAQQLENELTMATERCNALKATLEATKQATQTAIKKGILTPKKRGAPRVRNVFDKAEAKKRREEEEDSDVDDDEAEDQFFVEGSESGSESDSDIDDLEESYEQDDSPQYADDDTFAIRRAEAKLGLEPDVRQNRGVSLASEAKSHYQQRAEAKNLIIDTGNRENDNIVTPRIRILSDAAEEAVSPEHMAVARDAANAGRFRELSDAPSPSARIEDRVKGLRHRCETGLGAEKFERAYTFLKRLQEEQESDGGMGGGMGAGGDEETVLRALTDILGEENLHYWSLVDQLLFCEELRQK